MQATFADLLGLVGHLTILDMAASFEVASQARLGTRLGEVRSALAAGGRKRFLPPYALRLVRDRDEFGSLRAVAALLDGEADEALLDAFDAVRQARNNFAHGTEILSAPWPIPTRLATPSTRCSAPLSSSPYRIPAARSPTAQAIACSRRSLPQNSSPSS